MLSTSNFQEPCRGAYVELDDLLGLRFAARELQLTPKQLGRSLLSGGLRTRFRGRGMEFEEVRHYQAGDDIRSIDWRVTARTSIPHTKLFQEERERPVIIMLDQRSSLFFGSQFCFKSVLATHLAALIGWTALNNNDRIGALIFNDSDERDIRPKRSRHTLLSILQEANHFNHQLTSPVSAKGDIPLSQRLSDLRRIARPGSALFIISDFHDIDRQCDEQLYQLARHGDVSLLQVSDPFESQLPGNMLLTVSDGQHKRTIDTRNRDLNDHFRQNFDNQRQHLTSLAGNLAIPLLSASTSQSAFNQLQSLYGKQARRK